MRKCCLRLTLLFAAVAASIPQRHGAKFRASRKGLPSIWARATKARY